MRFAPSVVGLALALCLSAAQTRADGTDTTFDVPRPRAASLELWQVSLDARHRRTLDTHAGVLHDPRLRTSRPSGANARWHPYRTPNRAIVRPDPAAHVARHAHLHYVGSGLYEFRPAYRYDYSCRYLADCPCRYLAGC